MESEKRATAPVSNLCQIYLGGTPRRSEPSYWGGSIKWATAADVASCSTRYLEKVEQTITEKGVAESAAKVFPKNTIVITARGTVGSLCMLPEPIAFNQTCYGLVAREGVIHSYLYYALKAAVSQINSLSYGTVFNTITMKSFDSLCVPVPPLKEQQAIAHILGTLDDKIELNRQMNQTLEAIARAIFKSWFVDFDPVHAKMDSPSPIGRGVRGEGIRPTIRTNAPIPTDILDFARQMRRQATDAEALLWRLLRGRQIANAKFRRQHSFHPYILDFYCHELKLAVELDGGQHNLEADRRRDARRDAYLAEHGIRVLRFWNNDVLRETEAVLEAIYAVVVERVNAVPSPPAPLPEGEGSYPQHILDLFPDRLVDSELGQIPKGWEVINFSEILVEIVSGSRPKGGATKYGVPSIGAENVLGLGHYDYSKEKYIPADFFEKLRDKGADVRPRDVLLYKDGAQVGRKTYFDYSFPHEVCAVNEHVFILRTKELEWQRYLFFWLNQDRVTQEIVNLNSNSAQPGINKTNLLTLKVLSPSNEVVYSFERSISPLIQRLFTNCHESRTLSALRDALLPKLICGELPIPDAEQIVGRCV